MARAIVPGGLEVVRPAQEAATSALGQSADLRSASEVRAQANEEWNQGRRPRAIEMLRARAVQPGGEALWWPLYFKLVELGRHDAASLALRSTVQFEPENLGALELYIEDVEQRGPKGMVTKAFDKLPDMLRKNPHKHRNALSFVVPAKHAESLRVLRDSDDAVVREVMCLVDGAEGTEAETKNTSVDQTLARALHAMAVGKNAKAIEFLEALPDKDKPVDDIRVTVRRLLRTKKHKAANRYLQVLAPLLPQDRWVQSQLLATGKGLLTPYQLSKRGFPFTKKAKEPKYEPRLDSSLYLLHNSLPYHSAGYATRTHGLLTALKDQGWNVQGVTRIGYPFDMPKYTELGEIEPMDVVDGIPYHRLSVKHRVEMKKPIQLFVDRYSSALEKLALRERPFVIHAASNHWNGLAAVQTANRLGIPSIYEVRGLWEVTRGSRDPQWAKGGMFRYMAKMESESARGATRVLAITHALKDELVARGVDPDKITIVPNGVNADRFEPRQRNEELAREVGVAGKPVIGYIGSVLDYEGLGLLIDAAEMLRNEGRDFAVMIVGDGAELEHFQAEVEERSLKDVVIFTGRVPHEQVEEYYSLVDIAPFPRLPLPVCEMVSPLKPFEAMAMEKAVVASNVAALAEIVQDGVTGLLHRKGDAADLKEKLALLLDDPELRKRFASAGRNWVLSERRWSDLGKLVAAEYEALGGRPAATSGILEP